MPAKKIVLKTQKPKAETKKSTAVASVVKKAGLFIDVYDVKGKVVETIQLSKDIFGEEVNKPLIAQAVRVFLANRRSGTASTKTRGEVVGSTRKIYKQKGTGRARHGAKSAPIFVHGGVAHGPKPVDYSLSLPKAMKRKALFAALSAKFNEGQIKIVSGFEKLAPKTKNMAQALSLFIPTKKEKKLLLVLPKEAGNTIRIARNIEGVSYVSASQINTYDVLNNKTVIFFKDALSLLEEVFVKKN